MFGACPHDSQHVCAAPVKLCIDACASAAVQTSECICRVSEVRDWEAGGRTSAADLDRIFDRELEAGGTKVTVLLRTGAKGVAFCKALNRCEEYPVLPAYEDDRRATCIWGEVCGIITTALTSSTLSMIVNKTRMSSPRGIVVAVRS